MKRERERAQRIEVLEPFTFKDGVRLAWVTWRIPPEGRGERTCVGVRELSEVGKCAD